MSYYRIRCPQCLEDMDNNSVVFRVEGTFLVETPTEPNDEEFSILEEPTSSQSNTVEMNGFYTVSQLAEKLGVDNVKRIMLREAIPVPQRHPMRCGSDGDKLMRKVRIVSQQGLPDNSESADGYARHCCRCYELLSDKAGLLPFYFALLLGNTSAGKTTYLTALYHVLNKDGGYTLPPPKVDRDGYHIEADCNEIGNLTVNIINNSDGALRVNELAKTLFDQGLLPVTTSSDKNPPLCLSVSFTTSGGDNAAMLYLRDMPGEWLSAPKFKDDGTINDIYVKMQRLAERMHLYDSFILMIDPLTFIKHTSKNLFSDSEKYSASTDFVGQVSAMIDDVVKGKMGVVGKIEKPTAVIITKGDLFFEDESADKLDREGLNYSEPLLSNDFRETLDKCCFTETRQGTEHILSVLSPNITRSLIQHNFADDAVLYGLVASLSRNRADIDPIIENGTKVGKRLRTKDALSPWLVAMPFVHLLMRLGIAPPLYEIDLRRNFGESDEENIERNMRLINLLNSWGEKYCLNWKIITKDNNNRFIIYYPAQKGKKGLFGLLGKRK